MGLDRRKTSGRIFGGANLVVPDQPIYSVKNFPPSFQYKRGTPKDTFREIPQPTPTPTPSPTPLPLPSPTPPPLPSPTPPPLPSPTPVIETFYILTESQEVILTESGENIIY
jgi:hypothetical protein